MKHSKHCTTAIKKANKILGLINRTFTLKNETTITLYKALVHPHLEYAVQTWAPYLETHRKIKRSAKKSLYSCTTCTLTT